MRRNGCLKGCFWRVRFFSAPIKAFRCFKRATLKGAEKKRTLQKHPFGQPFLRTTPSPLLWRTPKDAPLPVCHWVRNSDLLGGGRSRLRLLCTTGRLARVMGPCLPGSHSAGSHPSPKYHTKGCSRSSVDSPGARTLVFAAFESSHGCEFRAPIAQTPFCAILWRSPGLCFMCRRLETGMA